MKLYTQDEVKKLLETQRGNCYVAILNETKDKKIASLAFNFLNENGKLFFEIK